MVNISESTYSSYLTYNGNFANFEYYTLSGNTVKVLPAWIESNNAGKLITWVKLPKGIPAKSNITIYLGFASTSSNLLSSSGTTGIGEAPQLSCGSTPTSSCSTYAEYDDGAGVFMNYWNFAGTSLPSGFSSLASGGMYSVSNGLTLFVPATNGDWIHVFTTSQYAPSIEESYVSAQTSLSTGEYDIAYTTVETATGGNEGYQTTYRFDNFENTNRIIKDILGSVPPPVVSASFTLPSSFIISGFWPTTGNEYMQINYANQLSTTDTGITYANANLDLFIRGAGSALSATTTWLRIRAYPPNGVMPTAAFGSVV